MNHSFGFRRLALLGLAVLALGLAGCGRKGPLDLPPQAGQAVPSDNQEGLAQGPRPTGALGVFDATDEEPQQVRGKPSKRRIFLDPLLD